MREENQRDAEEFQHYLRQVQRIAITTPEEEAQLLQRIARAKEAHDNGTTDHHITEDGKQARQRLIDAHLLLVTSIVQRYANRGAPLMDLVQAGNAGLERAVANVDTTKEYRFSTFATWWIRQTITQSIVY